MAKFGINDIPERKDESSRAAGTDRGIQRDLFKPLQRGKRQRRRNTHQRLEEHRRAGRRLLRGTGTAYSIGESKQGNTV